MIGAALRALALAVGLLAGLAAALAAGGRMAHLRALAGLVGPGALPGWAGAVAADAGLLAGRADPGGGLVLDWRLGGFAATGPVWALRLTGDGVALDLTARPGGGGLALRVEGGQAVLSGPELAGAFDLTGGEGWLDRADLRLDLRARAQRLRLAGAAWPDGEVRLGVGPGGEWRFEAGGGAVLTGQGAGALTGGPDRGAP